MMQMISSQKQPDGSLLVRYDYDLEGEARSIFEEIVRQKDTLVEEHALRLLSEHYGYVKPIKCRDCGAFTPWRYYDQEPVQGECKVFNCLVPCSHYCSYARYDWDEDE